MSEKMTLARIKKAGNTFEISVDPDKALEYRRSGEGEMREILLADNIFGDAKRGQLASCEELVAAFGASDVEEVAHIILTKGEIQLSSDHRAAERDEKWRRLVTMIHAQVIEPQSGLPHPRARIEAALEEAKVHLDLNHSVEEQFDAVISKLRPHIPIKIEKKKFLLELPGDVAGKVYGLVKNSAKMLREEWAGNGNWQVQLEIPAGLYPEFLEKLQAQCKGMAQVREL